MRGGGNGAALEAFPTPLGSTDILFNARNAPAFGPLTPTCPVVAGITSELNRATHRCSKRL